MRQSKMRILLLALFLSVNTSIFGQDFVVDGIWYLKNGEQTVSVTGDYQHRERIYEGNIIIPSEVTYDGTYYTVVEIGDDAFRECKGMKSIIIPNSVTTIGNYAFRDCSGLISATIGNNVTTIGMFAFYGCSSLKSIEIPNSVTFIGNMAFERCNSLSSVSIGNGLDMGPIFQDSENIDTVFYDAKEFDTFLFSNKRRTKISEITLGNNVESVNIEVNVHKLRCLANNPSPISFLDYTVNVNLLEVPYGHSLKYVKDEKWARIPIIYSISDNTRYYPVPIFNIGDYVVSVNGSIDGYEAKEGEEVSVNSYGTISNHPLIMQNTQNISNIINNGKSFTFKTSNLHSENTIYTYDFPLREITLSESGTLIDKIDIDNITNIENLKITGNINGTDLLVIRKMENLKLLDLKDAHIVDGGMSYYDNYTTSKDIIGERFFSNNKKLVNVYLPTDIVTIKDDAFFGCSELRTIFIPKTVKNMKGSIFPSCDNLHSVHIEDLSAYCAIKFNKYTWLYCHHDMYLNDEKIIDLVIPEGITTINDYAFYYLNGINSLVIPSSVTKIGDFAFIFPIKESITCLNPTPPEIETHTFDDPWNRTTYDTTTLYVPKGSKTLYWLHPHWENFSNIMELDHTGINDIPVDSSPNIKGIYTINGIKLPVDADNIEILPKGIYITNGEKVIIK